MTPASALPAALDATPGDRDGTDVRRLDRFVRFEQLANFRDLGGLRAGTGTVRPGAVFRCATMHLLTDADARRLDAMGVQTVIDLRTDEELERRPGRGAFTPARVERASLLRAPWSRDDLRADTDAPVFLAERYLDMIEHRAEYVAHALHVLAEEANHAVVFHCAAGKDRTGVLAAVLLGVLGVDDDTIADDYHATAPEMPGLLQMLADDHSDESAMVSQPSAFLDAPREAMVLVLNTVRSQWGDMTRYALESGTDASAIERLRQLLIVE